MRVFVAGATGVIGIRLVPLLVEAGHTVAGMTRSPAKAAELEALGAEAVVCDVYDLEALRAAVARFEPDAVMHQLTDLPDDASQIPELGGRNDRMRREGTRNLLAAGGVVIRYGQLYGPGTHSETTKPDPPRIHVDEAACRTMPILDAPAGIVEVVE